MTALSLTGRLHIALPSDGLYVILPPGHSIDKKFTLRGIGFSVNDFSNNQKYDGIAIYQNSLDVSVSDGNDLIEAWKGEIKSGNSTFAIIP